MAKRVIIAVMADYGRYGSCILAKWVVMAVMALKGRPGQGAAWCRSPSCPEGQERLLVAEPERAHVLALMAKCQ